MGSHHHKKEASDAAAFCRVRGLRLTKPRGQVLAILTRARKPLGAYDIIARMPAGTKPPTVYRALEFLLAAGLVHRIESLAAYVSCHCHADHAHDGAQFLICDGCGAVEELHVHTLDPSVKRALKGEGFRPRSWKMEIHGACASCASKADI